jgi:hypothetical protein
MAMHTVPRLAKEWGIAPKKITGYIEAGLLDAVNLASVGCTRPRYGISDEAIAAFLARRAVVPKVAPVRRKRTQTGPSGKDHFAHI